MLGIGDRVEVISITLLLLLVIAINPDAVRTGAVPRENAAAAVAAVGHQLYDSNDSVVILDVNNFKQTVYGSDSGWLVEFYISWCGHCFRFAPTWKALARDVYPWRDVVGVAAIDCANEDNNPICREYEVMYYPMLKFFPVKARSPFLGVTVEKGDNVDGVRRNLVDTLQKEQEEGRGSTWPNITPYRNAEAKDVWRAVGDATIDHVFLIFESPESRLGAEVILDMHNIPSLRIRRVTSDNESLRVTYSVTKFPSVVVLCRENDNDGRRILNVRVPSREGVRRVILDYLRSKGRLVDDPWTMIDQPALPARQQPVTGKDDQSSKTPNDDIVYRMDLDSALAYAIYNEIPLQSHIDGDRMIALKHFLRVLVDYYPRGRTSLYLDVLRANVDREDSMSGKSFKDMANQSRNQNAPRWIGCEGSAPRFRRYPCGLWTVFHVLSVNFALENDNETRHDPTKVLRAMHGYIKYFFGCSDCARHFLRLASDNDIYGVRDGDENILWLWRAHNQVNARLAGDETEDPSHKKIQYPAEKDCFACRYENGSWRIDQVLRYLKNKYSHENVNFYGFDDYPSPSPSPPPTPLKRNRNIPFQRGWDLTLFDFSICAVLYFACLTILIVVSIKFFFRRNYKKRTYVNLLGRV